MLLSASGLTPSELKGTIKLKEPLRGLGSYIDTDGIRWDIKAIFNDVVCARREDLHTEFPARPTGTTCTHDFIETWGPYKIIIEGVRDENNND